MVGVWAPLRVPHFALQPEVLEGGGETNRRQAETIAGSARGQNEDHELLCLINLKATSTLRERRYGVDRRS